MTWSLGLRFDGTPKGDCTYYYRRPIGILPALFKALEVVLREYAEFQIALLPLEKISCFCLIGVISFQKQTEHVFLKRTLA
jgi:hypothetical protein